MVVISRWDSPSVRTAVEEFRKLHKIDEEMEILDGVHFPPTVVTRPPNAPRLHDGLVVQKEADKDGRVLL